MEGIFGIYKPTGPTSHDIINKLRKITGERRIGHAGTLDPLAKGVLVVAISRKYTRKLEKQVAADKEYIAKIKLGYTSATDDAEGPMQREETGVMINHNTVKKVLKTFEDKIMQTPPAYSAIKLKGKRAYQLARKGKTPALKPRPVEIKKIALIKYKWPYLEIRVKTGKGVYIRSLARDIGAKLGVGGYLAALERTRVGKFTRINSLTLKEFASKYDKV
ncbi:MAG: tRNA pseudouridine(55) synthase TruB [Candidatus Colwellbacteria bacterium]|nr:tRNA pseudouridine(55) synthase TruB [Candidatus Colwellbacteria bacterium]